MKWVLSAFALALALVATPRHATAGFIVIDGTDANDHGSASGGLNFNGWRYMQRVLENLAAQRLAANPLAPKTVYNIGGDASTQSGNAIASAFNLSSLPASGWTLVNVTGGPAVNVVLSSASVNTIGLLAITTAGNATGDLDTPEQAAVNANAVAINNYLGAGGSLHAMAESGLAGYGWLSTLLPGFATVDGGTGGVSSSISLTAVGAGNFPGLSNADLSSGPWHNYFTGNFGGLSVLATAPDNNGTNRAIILGGVTGNITNPVVTATPLPPTAIAALGAVGVLGLVRRRRRAAS